MEMTVVQQAQAPRRAITFEGISHHFAAHYPRDMLFVVACNVQYAHEPEFLRVMSRARLGYLRLVGAVMTRAPGARLKELLSLLPVETIQTAQFEHRTLMDIATQRLLPELVSLLVGVPGFLVPESEFQSFVLRIFIRLHVAPDDVDFDDYAPVVACAVAIAASPSCSPATVVNGRSNLSLAAEAGLVDVVRLWLQDPRCTAELLQQRDADGHTAFTAACSAVVQWRGKSKNLPALPAYACRVAQCAQLLGWDSRVSPAWSGKEASQLAWAARAGLADVLRPWVRDVRATKEVFEAEAGGASLLEWCYGRYTQPILAAPQAGIHPEHVCVDVLASSNHCNPSWSLPQGAGLTGLHVACTVGAVGAVRAWVHHPDVTSPQLLASHGAGGDETPWPRAFQRATGRHAERERCRAIMQLMAGSGKLERSARGSSRWRTCLADAAEAGLVDVVQAWLAHPKCDRLCLVNSFSSLTRVLQDSLYPTGPFSMDRVAVCPERLAATRQCATIGSRGGFDALAGTAAGDLQAKMQSNFELAASAGLGSLVRGLYSSNTLRGKAMRAHGYSHLNCHWAFQHVCKALVGAQQLKDGPGKQDIVEDVMACVSVLLGMTGLQPEALAAGDMWVQMPEACDEYSGEWVKLHNQESISNLAAACHAGLVHALARWIIGAAETRTSAFGLACAQAADTRLSSAHRAEGAQLLVASGKVKPMDRVTTLSMEMKVVHTAFESAVQAGLTDIVRAWAAQVQAQPHSQATKHADEPGAAGGGEQ